MSKDTSMFKKMKERITDEVNSATNKLQNMQIIDQLASTIGQQMVRNDTTPNQSLPEPYAAPNFIDFSSSSNDNANKSFNMLKDTSPVGGGFNGEEEELNTEISPQHQLFDEHSILRLNQSDHRITSNNDNGTSNTTQISSTSETKTPSVITTINDINSDIEDAHDDDLDVEIDLLSDKPIDCFDDDSKQNKNSIVLTRYKNRYKTLVHTIRKLNQDFIQDKTQLEAQRNQLINQITALRLELDAKQNNNSNQHDSLISISTNVSTERDDKSSVGSPQPTTKASQKLKDLERLLSKCKESLKLKNKQIQALKDSLSEVEKFKESNQQLRDELAELREAHESWTVSIAENKRIMHLELENKNLVMEKMKGQTKDLQSKLFDSNSKIRQLKTSIQDLESRLVNTSAAHQKERESLIKELTISKNSAMRQIQQEYEHNIEKVKLDLEKSIETLKMEILNKDQQIIRSAQQQQQSEEKERSMFQEMQVCNRKLEEHMNSLQEYKANYEEYLKKCNNLEERLVQLESSSISSEEVNQKNQELNAQVEDLSKQLSSLTSAKIELEEQLKNFESIENTSCDECTKLRNTIDENTEMFQQQLHELHSQLNLMTTANEDFEKEILASNSERDKIEDSLKYMKLDFEELVKKNESLTRILNENETDMQTQQEQLDHLGTIEQELDNLKRDNFNLSESLDSYKNDLDDKNADISQLKIENQELVVQLDKLKSSLETANKTIDKMAGQKSDLAGANEKLVKEIHNFKERVLILILATMRNLETPNTSPGSDKSFSSNKQATGSVATVENDGDKGLPDPIVLMEELSSLALDRSNSYMTATQRLQAVLLDNSLLGAEIERLKDELNNVNNERSIQAACSIDEADRLQTENQALIHDQQAYDDRINSLEEEIEILNRKIAERSEEEERHRSEAIEGLQAEKDALVDRLAKLEQQLINSNQTPQEEPEHNFHNSTEFEYLKNIVYQFMLGKQPITLARVISAVLKFDKNQIDQICKVQETVQTALGQGV